MLRAKRLAVSRGVETRRLYRFENVFTRELPYFARRGRRIGALRALAIKVWTKHGRVGLEAPSVVCGAGTRGADGLWLSYALGYGRIVLARAQRTNAVLLHEITHALGHGTHGAGFVRKYLQLLAEYGNCDEGELRLAMGLFKVKH